MKILASESKPFQSCSKGKIPSRVRWKEWLSCSKLKQAFLIDSDAKLFMYLIQCIRFSSWKLRHVNQALLSLKKTCFTTYHLLLLCKASCEALVNSTTRSSVANTYWEPANGYMPIKQMSRDDGGHLWRKIKQTSLVGRILLQNPHKDPSDSSEQKLFSLCSPRIK